MRVRLSDYFEAVIVNTLADVTRPCRDAHALEFWAAVVNAPRDAADFTYDQLWQEATPWNN
jgi:hypothetical protein